MTTITAISEAEALTVRVLDSSLKIQPYQTAIPPSANTLRLAAVRGEARTAQILLSSIPALTGVTIEVTPMVGPTGTFPAEDIHLFLLHPVHVEQPSDARGIAGMWPDALVPLRAPLRLKANWNHSIIIRVYVREGVPHDIYSGHVVVKIAGQISKVIPMSIAAWGLDLPKRVSLPIILGVDTEAAARIDGAEAIPGYYDALRRSRAFPIGLCGTEPDVQIVGANLSASFAAWEMELDARYADDPDAPIHIPFTEEWPVDVMTQKALAIDYLRKAVYVLDQRNLMGRAYIYVGAIDEATTPAQYALAKRIGEIAAAADYRLRVVQTVFQRPQDASKTVQDLDTPATMWAPNLAFYAGHALSVNADKSFASVPSGLPNPSWRSSLGSRSRWWWYFNPWTAILPNGPSFPNFFIDHNGIETRALGWLAFLHRIDALTHWDSTSWTTNPWAKLPLVQHAPGVPAISGDGSLLYPAKGTAQYTGQPVPDGPVTSLRLELLREASEDYELLKMLADRGQATLAVEIATRIAPNLVSYQRNEWAYRDARREIVTALMNPGAA